jgi:hypothetical protein
MTRPTTTHDTPLGLVSDGGADSIWYARAVLADATDHDDLTIATACRSLIEDPDIDPDTWFKARDMLVLVEGEAA